MALNGAYLRLVLEAQSFATSHLWSWFRFLATDSRLRQLQHCTKTWWPIAAFLAGFLQVKPMQGSLQVSTPLPWVILPHHPFPCLPCTNGPPQHQVVIQYELWVLFAVLIIVIYLKCNNYIRLNSRNFSVSVCCLPSEKREWGGGRERRRKFYALTRLEHATRLWICI